MANVYIFKNDWMDRHGDNGSSTQVFSTANKANTYLDRDIRSYIHDCDLSTNGKLALDRIKSFKTKSLKWNSDDEHEEGVEITVDELVAAALKCGWLKLDRDGDTTKSNWSVRKEKIL